MPAIWMRVQIWSRRNVVMIAIAAAVVGVLAGTATGIAAGTVRTASAPDRYTSAFGDDPDMTITQQSGRSLREQIARVDGVEVAHSIVFVAAFLVAPTDNGSLIFEPNPFAGDADVLGTRVVHGRFPDPSRPDEFVVNRPLWDVLHDTYGTRIGDVFDGRSFDQAQVAANFDGLADPAGPTFTATLVGVTEAPAEFDDPSQQVVFSPAFLKVHDTVGVVQSLIAVQLEDGIDPADVMVAVRRLDGGGDAFAVPTRIVSDSARRAVSFQVTALWLVTALAALAAAAVIAQVVARTLRLADTERQSMLALGWRHRELAVERGLEALVLAVVAVPITATVAFAITGFFPVGVLRLFEPDRGRRMDWTVVALGATALTAVAVSTGLIIGHRAARRAPVTARHGLTARLTARGARVPLTVGSHFATSGVRGRGSGTTLVVGALVATGVVGSMVVGLSLSAIVAHPARWGVAYDTLFGNPYTYADSDIITPIADVPGVEAVTGVNIGSVTINGSETATIGFDQIEGAIAPVVVEGRLPLMEGEIGIGAEVQRRLRIGVGDTVEVAGTEGGSQPFVVVGTVVTPDSAGNGAAMLFDSLLGLNPTATENVALVDFGDGAPDSARTQVSDITYSPPDALVTPTSVRALERVTTAPYLLAVVLTFLAVVGCAYLLTTSVRGRRRDLSILRALGSESRQLRSIVHWHATIVATIALVVGLPLGVVAGRLVVGLLTDALGIVPGAEVSIRSIGGVVVVGVVGANVLALLPARRAASTDVSRFPLDGQ